MKIDYDPIGVAVDLAIDSLFFLWLARNKEKVGRILYASSSAAYPINRQKAEGHLALREEHDRFLQRGTGAARHDLRLEQVDRRISQPARGRTLWTQDRLRTPFLRIRRRPGLDLSHPRDRFSCRQR